MRVLVSLTENGLISNITVEIQAVNDAKDYLTTIRTTQTIIARYEGSKYWNEDAKHGIEMGVTMVAAPVAFSPLTEVEGQVALINYITKGSRVFVSLETIGKIYGTDLGW